MKNNPKNMRILALASLSNGVSYHRITMPYFLLTKVTEGMYLKLVNNVTEAILEEGWDYMVMNRSVNFSTATLQEWKRKYNFKLIVDNDDYWELDPHHVLAQSYHQNNTAQKIIDFINIADICTVTNERLAEKVYQHNKAVYVLPNALPYGTGQFVADKLPSDKVRLFWSGSDTHAQDISILRNPMKKVFSDHSLRTKIKTVMAGYYHHATPVWDVMASAFTHALQFDSTIYEYAHPDKYMAAYWDSDISVIPLLTTPFNSFKSNLKVLEAAAKRNPCIVSETNPYLGLPVCYVRSQQYWYRWIKELVNDEAMRIEKGNDLFEYCNSHYNVFEVNKLRLKILNHE